MNKESAMIKVNYVDYYSYDKYEKLIEGNLPEGVKRVEASYDGGRGAVYIGDETVLDDLGAGDYSVNHKGVSLSVDRGRFYFGADGVSFQDLSAGSDFNFIFEQV